MRDADLIALLLAASRPAVAASLTGRAKLPASGVLHLGSRADLSPLERLMSLIRRNLPPVADIYDQLVEVSSTEPLEWEAFAHLGREAELAAEALRAAVARREAGLNILLYGPPGTGKTSFAATLAARIAARLRPVATLLRWRLPLCVLPRRALSHFFFPAQRGPGRAPGYGTWPRLGLPVLQKRASDLLDPFVGGTEHKIADAFAEARDTGALLVFDDADSLLLERADAVRSWEISKVNEMLTWMESHPCPFACTTNLAERMDRASLRRFLVKLRLDWLTGAQARLAFRRFFAMAPPEALDALQKLTPADFALVGRRAAVNTDSTDPGAMVRLLAAECAGRGGAGQAIGLVIGVGK
jgi:SpoVK/Ycf46/Vps4 family AAA+-type ATPase